MVSICRQMTASLVADRATNIEKDKALYRKWRAASASERPAIEAQRAILSNERFIIDFGKTRADELGIR